VKIIKGLQNMPRLRHSAVCVGIFDGVHLGHQRIIRQTVSLAKKKRIPSVCITFDPHPARVLKGIRFTPMIYSLSHRLLYIESMGVDYCLVVPFTKKFSRIPYDDFIDRILVKLLRTRALFVGHDFRFGYQGRGDITSLRRGGKLHGYKLKVQKAIRLQGRIISSTYVRDLISKGHLQQAAALLGRLPSIWGSVIKGKGRGRRMGFPTLNLESKHETFPPKGVYAVMARANNRRLKGVLHLGPRPTFNEGALSIELHLLKNHNAINFKELEIFWVRFIREVMKFKSQAYLAQQIQRDTSKAKIILS
jgi:riboflavin kinase / FMN adenylyltransferase